MPVAAHLPPATAAYPAPEDASEVRKTSVSQVGCFGVIANTEQVERAGREERIE